MKITNTLCLLPDGSLERRDLLIAAGRLQLLPPAGEAGELDGSRLLCLGGMANAHFHGLSTPGRGLEHDLPLTKWFGEVPESQIQARVYDCLEQEFSPEDWEAVALLEYMELARQGVTLVFDGGTLEGTLPAQKKALETLGIRGVLDAHGELPAFAGQDSELVTFAGHLLEEEDFSEENLTQVQEQVRQYPERIFGTHCLETRYRRELAEKFGGKATPSLLEERGLLSPRSVLYHCVHATAEDWNVIARSGAGVVHNPVSNLYTGTGIMDLSAVLDRGIPCGLGTDWGSVDWWETVHTAYHLLKVQPHGDRYQARDVLGLACQGGNALLGHPDCGVLRDGARADLVFMDLDSPRLFPDFPGYPALLHNLVTQATTEDVLHVMVEGKWIVRNRACVTVEEEKVRARWRQVMEKLSRMVSD